MQDQQDNAIKDMQDNANASNDGLLQAQVPQSDFRDEVREACTTATSYSARRMKCSGGLHQIRLLCCSN